MDGDESFFYSGAASCCKQMRIDILEALDFNNIATGVGKKHRTLFPDTALEPDTGLNQKLHFI